MTLAATKMTAEQFFRLGEDPPGPRLELVNGEIAGSPSPSFDHSCTDTKLRAILSDHIEANDLGAIVGDVDTIFDALDVRRPGRERDIVKAPPFPTLKIPLARLWSPID